uniref:Adenylate cyclase type 10 n=2 Tax=Bombyx mori TaxID=7091 RepID=A0A8R2M3C6_BOMMO|nr:adenylate cyclase type 10 isoform X1 [Bombyx mori]
MMAYPNVISCDKETFLKSKLNQEYFRVLEIKPLKGIAKPGPVYEFSMTGWSQRSVASKHPILGRTEELSQYEMYLHNAILQHQQDFTRYRDNKFAIAFIGPNSIGKTRLLEECLVNTPKFIKYEKFVLDHYDKVSFKGFHYILSKVFTGSKSFRENSENRVRFSIDLSYATPIQIHAVNIVFDCRFPLPENFQHEEDLLDDLSVKQVIRNVWKRQFKNLWVAAIDNAHYLDDESWRVLLIILDTKTVFMVIALSDDEEHTPTIKNCLENSMIVNIRLSGIDRWFHAALACQLLDVQAIPADLEKVIETASAGMPGWIQNFVISLVQRGALSIVTVTREEAIDLGAVVPSSTLLRRTDVHIGAQYDDALSKRLSYQSIYSILSISAFSKQGSTFTIQEMDTIQMAVLAESFNFDDITMDMSMDAVILKTYDSLNPYEKMLLKCASVLGDVFSRRMLMHLLQNDSPRTVALAVAKLFVIRVLECEGGDFTRDLSMVLVHPAPTLPSMAPSAPYCKCLGTRQPACCEDLPNYAFCGYMKFRHPLFRSTTYDLLTENQKHDMHARALLYLERFTRRCLPCGGGCFSKFVGLRCDDGLVQESEAVKRTRHQIRALKTETVVPGDQDQLSVFAHEESSDFAIHIIPECSSLELLKKERSSSRFLEMKRLKRLRNKQMKKGVRSFSSVETNNCECLTILMTVYSQIIDHCRGAGEFNKLYEAYIEYVDINLISLNVPQAIRLLIEVENFVQNEDLFPENVHRKWIKRFQLAKICSMRGVCMLESGDLAEAKKQLLHAMELYYYPFPTSKHWVKLRSFGASLQQLMAVYLPKIYPKRISGIIGYYYEDIAFTLNILYQLFSECKETENAKLEAKCALNYALKTNANFRLLCICYGNMISVNREERNFRRCLKLKERAMELCHRKRGQLDVTEVQAVCYLYTCMFLFYVEYGKKMEGLELGLSVIPMLSDLTDLNTRQMLLLWLLKLLLADLRINEMVNIIREFFYMTDHYDLSSETWYYFYAIVILLDTGYCVESYGSCEKFYITKGDAILRSKTPEAAWNFFVAMWLITVRIGSWEQSIIWEEKIRKILSMKYKEHEFNIMMLIRLVEGLLITLVKETDQRNLNKILLLKKSIKSMFRDMNKACCRAPMYRPRLKLLQIIIILYYLLYAYFLYIKKRKLQAFNLLKRAYESAKQCKHISLLIWIEHTRSHWRGTLTQACVDHWIYHLEPDNLLDYTDFDPEKIDIVPFTLPLPNDIEK